MESYLDGHWLLAKGRFAAAVYARGASDGPSETLLRYMASHNFQAPSNWPGFRELTDK